MTTMNQTQARAAAALFMAGLFLAALFLAALFLAAAPAARAGDWRFNGAEFPEGFHGLVYYEDGQTSPLALACAWRRDGEDTPLTTDDGALEGQPTTPDGQLTLDLATEITGGDGVEVPALVLRIDAQSFADLAFEGDLVGSLYHTAIPLDGPLTRALRAGATLELRSSMALEPWSTSLEGAGEAMERLLAFCAKRVVAGG